MNILIVCGEASANAYGTDVSQSLQKQGHQIFSIGDTPMATVSHQIYALDSSRHSVGYGEWMRRWYHRRAIQPAIATCHAQHGLDGAIIIDFPNHNFSVAAIFSSLNIPIITFITPNFWLWNQQKMGRKLAQYSRKIITIFEKEYQFYHALCPQKTAYFGHPLARKGHMPNDWHHDNDKPHIGVFPGSRHGEIRQQLPTMCRVLNRLMADTPLRISMCCANTALHGTIRSVLARHNLKHLPITPPFQTPMAFAITAPGTNTLQLALHGIPMAIIGRLPLVTYWIAKHVLRLDIPFIGLPNIILNQAAFPEYIQSGTSPSVIAETIATCLHDNNQQQTMMQAISDIQHQVQSAATYYDDLATYITQALKSPSSSQG